jgi:DNA-binding NarL/FixJ family response regulator
MKRCGGSSVRDNVFIADGSHLMCELMAKALTDSQQRIAVVGLATDSAGVRKGLAENSADVALISANLGDGRNTGFQVVREVRTSHPLIGLIMLVDSDERSSVAEAFRARADGIFTRDGAFEMLCKCIHAVHEGQIWANSKQLRFVIEIFSKREEQIKSATGASLLTKREEELAYRVAEGLTNADISRQLNLSEHTVRNYLFRVFNKLGVSNRLELALYIIGQREASNTHALAASRALEFSGDPATAGQVSPPRSPIVHVAFDSPVPTRLKLERREG